MPHLSIHHRLRAAVIAGSIALSGVAFANAAETTAERRTYEGALSTFDLPSKAASKTRTRDLYRLVDALDKGYAQFDLAPPYPKIRIVDQSHDLMPQNTLAISMRTESGQEFIYFNRQSLRMRRELEATVMHELAHIKTWREHGIRVREHGTEFKQVCRAATAHVHCRAKSPGRKSIG